MSRFFGVQGSQLGKFEDPFLLPSKENLPLSLTTAMDYCRFLYHETPLYRAVSKRVVGYFVTKLDFRGDVGSPTERDDFQQFFVEELGALDVIRRAGEEERCLAAGTRVVCETGIYPIEELVGKTVNVLSKGGVYRPADFKSFGVQELFEVTFTDGRSVFATASHEWEVLNKSKRPVRIPTSKLREGHGVERTVAPRPERNEEYREGVRHGFIFGDGHVADHRKRKTISRAVFYGKKDEALLPFFEGHGHPPRRSKKIPSMVTQSGFPGSYKELPPATASASYWYGFLCGFFAADGSVDTHGCAVLTQKSSKVLEAVAAQLPRFGMCAGPVRSHEAWVIPPKQTEARLHRMTYMTLLKRFMCEEDFLIPQHQDNFRKSFNPSSNYGRFIAIASVKPTGRFEEVFCCVEMQTHTFVVDNGILTGNCYGNSFLRVFFPFVRTLIDRRNLIGQYTLSMFPEELITFDLDTMTYSVPDPMRVDMSLDQRPKIALPFRDTAARDFSKIRLDTLDPRYVRLRFEEWSRACQVQYTFSPEMKAKIRQKLIFHVNHTPANVLRCIADRQDYLFDESAVFHLKNTTLAGVNNEGWGLPEILVHHPSIHQVAVYNRIDESIGLDHMQPLRIIVPDPRALTADNRMSHLADTWVAAVDNMVSAQRKDRSLIHGFPYPAEMRSLGGDGKALAPKDVREYEVRKLLDGMGYPEELIRGAMNAQMFPTMMAMFESSFMPLSQGLRNAARFAVKKISRFMFGEEYDATLASSRVAYDMERKNILLSLYAAGDVTRRTTFEALGIERPVDEKVERGREDLEAQERMAGVEEEFKRRAELGSIDKVLDASQESASASAVITPTDLRAQADQLAQQWLAIPSDGQRSQAMAQARASNPDLYAVAKDVMETIRAQGASQGRQAAGQQFQQPPQ